MALIPRKDQLVVTCPFCAGLTDAHCHYSPAPGATRSVCDLRRCRNDKCRAYGRQRDASRWVRPAVQ